tara:strand:+ start:245 stop:535 length:291 start_codon:yes stop_codon:yes gene_type:complete
LQKFIFVFLISIFDLPLHSTPTIRSKYEEVFDSTIPIIFELILEKHNIDIENRGLFLGYFFDKKNDCEYSIKLIDKSNEEYFFNLDICNFKSTLRN